MENCEDNKEIARWDLKKCKIIGLIFAPLLFTILSCHDISAQDLLHDMFNHPEKYTEDMNKIFSTYSDGETLAYSEGSVTIVNNHTWKRIILISKEGDHFAIEWKDEKVGFPYFNPINYRDHPYSYGSTLNELLKSVSNQSEDEKKASLGKKMQAIIWEFWKSIWDTVIPWGTHPNKELYFDVLRSWNPNAWYWRNGLRRTARSNP